MGFFSWDCKECGESIKAPYDIPKDMEWQNDCVAILKNGSTIKGGYDGYGRVAGSDVSQKKPTIYHLKCWDRNKKYHGESKYSRDQGFFYKHRRP